MLESSFPTVKQADDHLTRLFGVGELLARMRVVLRRAAPGIQDGIYTVKDLVVDLNRHQVTARRMRRTAHPFRCPFGCA